MRPAKSTRKAAAASGVMLPLPANLEEEKQAYMKRFERQADEFARAAMLANTITVSPEAVQYSATLGMDSVSRGFTAFAEAFEDQTIYKGHPKVDTLALAAYTTAVADNIMEAEGISLNEELLTVNVDSELLEPYTGGFGSFMGDEHSLSYIRPLGEVKALLRSFLTFHEEDVWSAPAALWLPVEPGDPRTALTIASRIASYAQAVGTGVPANGLAGCLFSGAQPKNIKDIANLFPAYKNGVEMLFHEYKDGPSFAKILQHADVAGIMRILHLYADEDILSKLRIDQSLLEVVREANHLMVRLCSETKKPPIAQRWNRGIPFQGPFQLFRTRGDAFIGPKLRNHSYLKWPESNRFSATLAPGYAVHAYTKEDDRFSSDVDPLPFLTKPNYIPWGQPWDRDSELSKL
jgi:hypothetical protein